MNYTDYTWFTQHRLYYAFCLTSVKGIDPPEALRRLDAQDVERLSGLDAFMQYAEKNFPFHTHNPYAIGATALDGGTLLVEYNGFLGTRRQLAGPLSVGTDVATHSSNVDRDGNFLWLRDGEVRLEFDPMFPCWRSGSDPDSLVDVLREIGYDLSDDEDHDYEHYTEKTMVLSEYLTGLRLTEELLNNAEYLSSLVTLPR
ncbi:DUF6461 domain-containing protein [Kribbella sp. CA-253562]|uniref:DUF6461 domain-containing protein n=1 Tax=Kribbella sp. CA-253562 TaxID=3239942 RepID=UPI003D89CEA4